MRKRHVDKVRMAVERLIDGPEASLRRLCAGIRQPLVAPRHLYYNVC